MLKPYNTKAQSKKITAMVLLLKAKLNTLVKSGEFQQAIGLQIAIEMLEEFYSNELKKYAEENIIRKDD